MSLVKLEADKETASALYKARIKESLSWIVSPLKGLKGREFKAFHVRHEASIIELFFDLFFVANLATFTAVHEITTGATVRAYIGYFVLLWSTWFQITIFDVRFAQDSVYERFCKLYQFMAFVILAAVGANFDPGDQEANANYRIYQALTVMLGITRIFLAVQYLVVACFVVPKHRNVLLPFALIIGIFLVTGAAFLALMPSFNKSGVNVTSTGWWIIVPFEGISVIAISSFWRMLSFKQSHLNERLSLLTIIIIGEGVIGVTKVVGKMWPTDGLPEAGVVVEVLSIVTLLFILWQTYFDNAPHTHFGTIKQQWWALGHFFLHLGYVGMVEGSNQMAVYYSALRKITVLLDKMNALCQKRVTDTEFVATLKDPFEIAKVQKYDSLAYANAQYLFKEIEEGKIPRSDYCANGADDNSTFWDLYGNMGRAYMAKFDIIAAKDTTLDYAHTFKTTYVYYWASVAVTLFILLLFLFIVRSRYRRDAFEIVPLVWRIVMTIVSVGLIFVYLSENTFYNFISSYTVVLTVVILMTLSVFVDRVCRYLGTRRFKRKFQIPPENHVNDSDKNRDHDDSYYGRESPDSTLLSHIGPIGIDSRPSHLRHNSTQSNVSHTDYAPSYTSIDPSSHAGGISTGIRPTYTGETSSETHVYGTDYRPAYGSGSTMGYGQDIGSYSQQPVTAYSSGYGAPVAGPYEPLRG